MNKEHSVICNGYSNYVVGATEKEELENFTLRLEVTPYTYETVSSGIFSSFDASNKEGILIAVQKGGIVEVKLGMGNLNLIFYSKVKHLEYQTCNQITISFWGTAGWCDLYINGVRSNRIQFGRHSKVYVASCNYYIGKYVDGQEYLEDTKRGIFHGEIKVHPIIRNYRSNPEMVNIFQSEERNPESKHIDLYKDNAVEYDPYRPVYHLIAPGKWMNEPHAPFYYKGMYHIFYQANPHAPLWDNLCWGHLVSKDMIAWKYAGIALNPDDSNEEDYDADGCWSGSACLDWDGNPMLFYTAGNNKEIPNQSIALARPEDLQDPELKSWEKSGVILRQEEREGFLGEFRDPFVWREEDDYYMLVGTGDSQNGGGNAILYAGKALDDLNSHGFIMEYDYRTFPEVGHVWELPVLLPLRDREGNQNCHILLICACQVESERVETYYFLGEFHKDSLKFEAFHREPRLLDLGNGIFTGPSGFVTPDGRSVVFTIAQGARDHEDEYRSGWAHNGGLPVSLSVENSSLLMEPIHEIRMHFTELIFSAGSELEPYIPGNLLELNLLENRIFCQGNGDEMTLVIDYGVDAYQVIYERKNKHFYVKSRKTNKVLSKYRGPWDEVDIGDDNIMLECYLDHSMIEIYLNCKKSITLRNYMYKDGYTISLCTDRDYCLKIWGSK